MSLSCFVSSFCKSDLLSISAPRVAERLKRAEQGRLEQDKWKRRMENESADAQEQLSDLGLMTAELRGTLSQKEKEITVLQAR